MSKNKMRQAVVLGFGVTGTKDNAAQIVARYLPSNYNVVSTTDDNRGRPVVNISGIDVAGWTLEGYVIPRLASGNYACKEMQVMKIIEVEEAS